MNAIARITLAETRTELTKLSRVPAYAVSTLAFPLAFYWFFGIAMGFGRETGSTTVATYMLASYGAFGVVGCALFGFGVSLAIERGQGWLDVKRASPLPPAAYVVAKVVTSLAFAVLVVLVLCAVGAAFGGVRLPSLGWFALAAALVLGALPFCALGLALGAVLPANSASATINLIYLPMSFASGLWIPYEQLPAFFQRIAPALPTYHLGQLALGTFAPDHGSAAVHVAVLLGWAAVGLVVAAFALRRAEGRTYA